MAQDQRNMPCWPTNTELHARRDRQVEGKQSNTPTSAHASLHTSWVDRRRNPLPPACPCAKTQRAWSPDLTPPPLHPRLRLLSNMPRMRFDSMLACSYAPMLPRASAGIAVLHTAAVSRSSGHAAAVCSLLGRPTVSGHAGHRVSRRWHPPSPTLSPTDPVPRGLLTLCPGASSGPQGQ